MSSNRSLSHEAGHTAEAADASSEPDAATGRPLPAAPRGRGHRHLPVVLLLLALVLTAAVTLRPVGDGWLWGAPVEEIRWYLGGLDSPATLRQLLGNVLLLAPAASAAVLCLPRLAGARRLAAAALLASLGIEGLQWLLPLGRVVSPTDVVLNTSGAVLAGLLTARLAARAAAGRTVAAPGPMTADEAAEADEAAR